MSRNAQDLYLSCKGWLNNEGYGCMMTCWMTFLSTSGVKKIRSFLGFPSLLANVRVLSAAARCTDYDD